MTIVKTSSKCQIVIPKEIREKFNIKPKGKVLIKAAKDHVEIVPLPDSPIEMLTGMFKDYPRSLADELLRERREDDKEDEKNNL
ncbi:TPA: AbrB family transcriptional regulator [bacterium]|nr:AbrB family transcriptional regulator [bacterium]